MLARQCLEAMGSWAYPHLPFLGLGAGLSRNARRFLCLAARVGFPLGAAWGRVVGSLLGLRAWAPRAPFGFGPWGLLCELHLHE